MWVAWEASGEAEIYAQVPTLHLIFKFCNMDLVPEQEWRVWSCFIYRYLFFAEGALQGMPAPEDKWAKPKPGRPRSLQWGMREATSPWNAPENWFRLFFKLPCSIKESRKAPGIPR